MGKSKHAKKSWRKTDVRDVDAFLEDERLQERLGTNFATKPDRELFVVDVEPLSEDAAKKKAAVRLPRAHRRKLLASNEPRCFQSLVNDSKVADPVAKRNTVRPVVLSERTAKKNALKSLKKRSSILENRRKTASAKEKMKKCRSEFVDDLWERTNDVEKKKYPDNEWLSYESILSNKLTIAAKRPTRKRLNLPAIDAPHPGISYNPSFAKHSELLNEVVEEELKVIKEEKHLNRVTSKMFRKISTDQLEQERNAELKQGLEHQSEDEEDDGAEYTSINPPVLNKKKDLKKRRNIREHNLMMGKAKEKAVEKKKIADIYKLRFLQKEIIKKENIDSAKKITRAVKNASTVKTPRLSSKPYVAPPPVLFPVENVTGSLRSVTPMGGLLDRFTSLQRRGIVPVSTPKVIHKAGKKRYTLSSHKLPWEQTEKPIKKKNKAK